MLIDIKKSLSGRKINGVAHVGAHWGQEIPDYIRMGAKYLVLFEPCEAAFNELCKNINYSDITIVPYNFGCADYNGTVVMKTSPQNQGQSNSILEPAKHTQYYKDIQFTTTEIIELKRLDEVEFDRSKVNMLVMDVQGAEALVLKGATETLKHIDYVYTEVNMEELYKGCAQVTDLDLLLSDFDRVETKWTNQGWGDAIYIRKKRMVNVPPEFRPKQRKPYPPDNSPSFEEYFFENCDDSLNRSDRIYLPVFWTNYYCNNNHKRGIIALRRLQSFLNRLDKTKKYFTIVQYDDRILNDVKHLDLKVFGMGCRGDYQLPLICQPHPYRFEIDKDTFACFVGKRTHKIREKVFSLSGKGDVKVFNYRSVLYLISDNMNILDYCQTLSRSRFSLCPRGYGLTSFRIAESLQYGAIPVYISDEHLIPHGIDFERYGVLLKPDDDIDKVLKSITPEKIAELQKNGKEFYENYMTFEANRTLVYENL